MSVTQVEGPRFSRHKLPEQFCNVERLLEGMKRRNLDGIVVSTSYNV